jgi:RimJ/RimL family protein N-acetyltransferase
LVKWRSNFDLIRFFREPKQITLQSHLEWFNGPYLTDNHRFDFIIIEKLSSKKIGVVGVNSIDYESRTYEIFYMIAEYDFQRKGLASEAVLAMIEKMHKGGFLSVYAEIHRDNAASINMVKKLGFSKASERGDFAIYYGNFSPHHTKAGCRGNFAKNVKDFW